MRDRIVKDEFGRREQAARLLREATADHICDIGIARAQDEFQFRSAVIPVDGALLIDSHVSPYSNERTPRHLARGSMDHYMITLCLSGEVAFAAGPRSATLRAGDLCLQDMAQASRTSLAADVETGLMRCLTLTLPRAALAPLLASPDGSTASLISRDSIQGRLLAAQFLALRGNGAAAGSPSSSFSIDALAGVIADAAGSARNAEAEVDRANRQLLLAAIKRSLALDLDAEIGVEQLCRRFRVSRATLYRLFEPEGGLWRYVQDQRLHRAFHRLASPATGRVRMVDMALDYHFASDTTFVRAFRRHFGLTPGEVRRLSALQGDLAPANGSEVRESLAMLKNFARP